MVRAGGDGCPRPDLRPRRCGTSWTTCTPCSQGDVAGRTRTPPASCGRRSTRCPDPAPGTASRPARPRWRVLAQGRGLRASRGRRRAGAGVPRVLPHGRRPRPAHLRDLLGHPRADHLRPERRHAGAVDPGGAAMGRHHRGPAGGHAGLGPHSARHGEAARDPGGHRRGPRRDRHHRRAHGGHRSGPAPAQDRERGAAAGRAVHDLRHPAAGRADDRVARHRVRRHRDEGEPRRRAGATR